MNLDLIKKLREETGAGIADCREALSESKGNMEEAKKWLKKKGFEKAAEKIQRAVNAGIVDTYIHHTLTSGATVVLSSETDFVARNPEFKELAHNIAQQVTATDPSSAEDLMNHRWIKDESKTVGDLIKENIAKFGENIQVDNFKRFEVGKKK